MFGSDLDYGEPQPGESRAEYTDRRIFEGCRLLEKPVFPVADTLLLYPDSEYPLHVREPVSTGFHFGPSYFIEFGGYNPLSDRDNFDETPVLPPGDAFRKAIYEEGRGTSGAVEVFPEVEPTRVTITFQQRRPLSVSEERIAQGLLYLDHENPNWRAATPTPALYTEGVQPHTDLDGNAHPIEWAAERMKLLWPLAFTFMGRDYPLAAAEYPVKELARLGCNTHPKGLHEKVYFIGIGDHERALLEVVSDTEAFPEKAYLVLSFAPFLQRTDLREGAIGEVLERLPLLLEHGLSVVRIVEAVAADTERHGGGREALEHYLRLADALYGDSERPWWFKEDFPLTPPEGSSLTPNERLALAQEAGPGFQYAESLFDIRGVQLASISGICRQEAISASAQVAVAYGIGNIPRACNVMDFLLAAVVEGDEAGRQEVLRKGTACTVRQAPTSPLIGVLEGSEVNFAKPGLDGMIGMLLGDQYLEEKKLDGITVSPGDLSPLVQQFAVPVAERALLKPAFWGPIETNHLLTTHTRRSPFLLPVAGEAAEVPPLPLGAPLTSWVDFDRRLHEECSTRSAAARVAKGYFHFYAAKMPNPFAPPDGFLGFLEKYDRIPKPELSYDFLFEEEDRSSAVDRYNQEVLVNRRLIVAHLLDAWVMGVLEWRDVSEVCDWLTEELSEEDVRHVEMDRDWNARDQEEYWLWDGREERGKAAGGKLRNLATYDKGIIHLRDETEKELLWALRDQRAAKERDQRDERYDLRVGRLEKKGRRLQEKWDQLQVRQQHLERAYEMSFHDPDGLDQEIDLFGWFTAGERQQLEEERGARLFRFQEWEDLEKRERSSRVFQDDEQDESGEETAWQDQRAKEEYVEARQLARLQALEETFAAIISINSLVAEEILDGGELREVLRSTILSSRERGDRVFERRAPSDELGIERRRPASVGPTQARAYLESEILDREELAALAQSPEGPAAFWRELYDFVGAHNSYIDILHRANQRMLGMTTSRVDRERGAVWSDIEDTFREVTLADTVALKRHFSRELWSARYVMVAEEAKPYREELRIDGEGNTAPWHSEAPSVHAINQMLLYHSHLVQLLDQARTSSDEQREKTIERRNPVSAHALPQLIERRHHVGTEQVIDFLRRSRIEHFGRLAIGAKAHFLNPIDENRLDAFKKLAGLRSTDFKLERANKSLIVPATPSVQELEFLLLTLQSEGIIDLDCPEIQLCGAGRLPPADIPFLACSVLLATEQGVQYDEEFFRTNRDRLTGGRIMLYDDGGERSPFPFDGRRHLGGVNGRTDMLGRGTVSDARIFNAVHTVLYQHRIGGPFRHLAPEFTEKFRAMLRKNDLELVLHADWIQEGTSWGGEAASLRHYHEAVKPCTDAWWAATEDDPHNPVGVVKDARELLNWLELEMGKVHTEILRDPQYEAERRALLFPQQALSLED
ncbi:hypothetical protein MRY87_03430 [bacterium]|nr:hypothetical protein [bacterium]